MKESEKNRNNSSSTYRKRLLSRSGLYGSKFSVQVLRVPFGPGNTKKNVKKIFGPI